MTWTTPLVARRSPSTSVALDPPPPPPPPSPFAFDETSTLPLLALTLSSAPPTERRVAKAKEGLSFTPRTRWLARRASRAERSS